MMKFTSDFTTAPDLEVPRDVAFSRPRRKEPSATSLTPRGSPKDESAPLPIVPQNTGEWRNAFPSFRQSLLKGKSLNRFSSFVTSGAEEWVLKGDAADAVLSPTTLHEKELSEEPICDDDNRLSMLGQGEAEQHFVEAGHSWKAKLPPFRVLVHSPSKRTSTLSGAYTIYSVASLFQLSSLSASESTHDPDESAPSPTQITVHRRFSNFVVLHTALTRRLPGIALPPLPEKQYAGRFSDDFVEARRGDLERYINRMVRHPVARYAEVVTFFLGCESDIVSDRRLLNLCKPII
jgi:sorting nexin-9/18/33